MKCCTKLETAKERCPIVFQGHPSNFKVTRDKTSPISTQIGRFRTIGRSQLSNPSDLPCSPFSHHRIIMKFSGVITMVKSDVHAKGQGQRSRSQRSTPNLAVSGLLNSSLNSHMAMKSCTRSSVKFQGHTALKIVEFDPDWTFPDRNSSFNPPMAMKCCTKLETAEVPYCFPKSSIKFQGHTGQNITDFDPNWAFPDYRLVAAFKYLRFALFKVIHQIPRSHGTNNCQF